MKSLIRVVTIVGAMVLGVAAVSVPGTANANDPTVCHSQGMCTVCDSSQCHVWEVFIYFNHATGQWQWGYTYVYSYPNPFPDYQEEY